MPKIATPTPALRQLLNLQYGVVSRRQLAAHGFTRKVVVHRLETGAWQPLLPGVVLTMSGRPTRQQLLVAALLWAGSDAAIDVVRRTIGEVPIGETTPVLRFVDPATAVVVAARGMRSEREAISVLSRGLQQRTVTVSSLRDAREAIGDKWCRRVDAALVAVGVGIRSPGENEARDWILSSCVLPEPLWNQWVDLGDGGGLVCFDGLWDDAAYAHEVNGRDYHAWGTQFDEMQARHDRATAAGITVMHNGLTRIRRSGPEALRELERGYLRFRGRGMPAGVRLVEPPSRPVFP